jgi:cell division septation protein DedD
MRIRVSAWLGLGVALGAFALGSPARAQLGTHAPAVSTYDTRASSIVFAYRHGFSNAGSFNTFSYNANFTSTTGRLSAQFGIHYVNYKESGYDTRAHGIGGSGVAVLEYPVAGRWEDGVPKAALALHLGGVPTAYISGERNFLTVPFVLGLGVPLSPHRVVTFTPWYELAIAANVDTIVRPEGVTIDSSSVVFDPQTQTASLKPGAVETALRQGVTIDVGVAVPMRAGLQGTLHLGRGADLDLYGMLSTLGGAFSGTSVKTVGAALVVRWDDIVPAVLPKRDAEPPESCEAIERRFRACPSSRHWLAPEQRGLPVAAPDPTTKGPAAAAPAPATPAKSPPATAPVTPDGAPTTAPTPTPTPVREPSPPANSQFPTP